MQKRIFAIKALNIKELDTKSQWKKNNEKIVQKLIWKMVELKKSKKSIRVIKIKHLKRNLKLNAG